MRYTNDQRMLVVQRYFETGDAKEISEEFGIPVRTIYRWGEIYKENDRQHMQKKSTEPQKVANRTSEETENLVCEVWFSLQIRNFSTVKRELGLMGISLSRPTIKSILIRRKIWD